MYKILSCEVESDFTEIIVLFTGRGQSAIDLLTLYKNHSQLNQVKFIAIEPITEWYPMPNGIDNQINAIIGLQELLPKLDDLMFNISKKYNIDKSKIILSGYSAGAVVAVKIATSSTDSYGAVVSHNGAILDTYNVSNSKNNTPFLLLHNKNDNCFTWEERYLPMKNTLLEKEYNLNVLEYDDGYHDILKEDVENVGLWIKTIFNHSNKEHKED